MRPLLSGAYLYDYLAKKYFQKSNQVTDVFRNNPLMQQALGYNHSAMPFHQYPQVNVSRIREEEAEDVPEQIQELYPNTGVFQVTSIKMNNKETIRRGTFVLVRISHEISLNTFMLNHTDNITSPSISHSTQGQGKLEVSVLFGMYHQCMPIF